MQIDPDYIINSLDEISRTHYRDGDPADRLAWQVGALSSKIRELCAQLYIAVNELEQLKKEIK